MSCVTNHSVTSRIMFHPNTENNIWKNFQDWWLQSLWNWLQRSSPVKAEICYCNCSCTDNFALHRRESLKSIPQTLKTRILKISSQNIFCIWVEHYSWCDRVIRDTWHTLMHNRVRNYLLHIKAYILILLYSNAWISKTQFRNKRSRSDATIPCWLHLRFWHLSCLIILSTIQYPEN